MATTLGLSISEHSCVYSFIRYSHKMSDTTLQWATCPVNSEVVTSMNTTYNISLCEMWIFFILYALHRWLVSAGAFLKLHNYLAYHACINFFLFIKTTILALRTFLVTSWNQALKWSSRTHLGVKWWIHTNSLGCCRCQHHSSIETNAVHWLCQPCKPRHR